MAGWLRREESSWANSNGVGDDCEDDCDGDGINDQDDVCPCNKDIDMTDFRGITALSMGSNNWTQPPPIWEFRDEGKEIRQFVNSAPGTDFEIRRMIEKH